MADEVLEDRELLRGERKELAAAARLEARRVDLEVGDVHDRREQRHPAPRQRANACQQLRKGEWLQQVVVGSRIEPGHPVGHLAARGEHQDGDRELPFAERSEQREAVDPRQAEVEQDEVVLAHPHQLARLLRIARDVDAEPGAPQSAHQRGDQRRVVFDHQELHLGIRWRRR